MKLRFEYNKEKDIWCLLNKGKSSINSPFPTEVYEKLVKFAGENPDETKTSEFIEMYLKEENLNISDFLTHTQKDFEKISDKFEVIAEKIFGRTLDKEITIFATVNNRCPYSIKENWFFISVSKENPVLTIMHELWHFYTWERFGQEYLDKIGAEKYNTIKESLTVILNLECGNLIPENAKDKGYLQHQELREKISFWWQESKNMDYVFTNSLKFLD